jgi:sRNA-binding regulator protein Hfq
MRYHDRLEELLPALPKSKAPAQTFEEAKYLRQLVADRTPVCVKMITGEEAEGTIEYWDQSFLRITREPDEPNLFVFKHSIRYIEILED